MDIVMYNFLEIRHRWGGQSMKATNIRGGGLKLPPSRLSSEPQLTIYDCAALSENCYKPSNVGGWTLISRLSDIKDQSTGFAASLYVRGKDAVLAYRGTSNMPEDLITDLRMVPSREGSALERLLTVMAAVWAGRIDTPMTDVSQALASGYNFFEIKSVVEKHANSAPKEQGGAAMRRLQGCLAYAADNGLKLRCVTGHSLGGALAQFASEQTGSGEFPQAIPGVSFNGPFMGDL
jgi:hypothetical protein